MVTLTFNVTGLGIAAILMFCSLVLAATHDTDEKVFGVFFAIGTFIVAFIGYMIGVGYDTIFKL